MRAEAVSWDGEWDKAKNVFFGFLPLAPTVGCFAPHSHPSPPEEKAASRKKSRLRRKKTAPDAKKWRIVYVKGGIFLSMILATTDPIRGSLLWLRYLQAALQASLSLAWSFSQYAISDGGISGYRGHLYKFFLWGRCFYV